MSKNTIELSQEQFASFEKKLNTIDPENEKRKEAFLKRGLTFDEVWEELRRENPELFEKIDREVERIRAEETAE